MSVLFRYLVVISLIESVIGSSSGRHDFSCSDSRAKICLPNGYDKTQAPSSSRNISIFFDIHDLSFNVHEMELDLSMEIKWRDDRIYNVDEREDSAVDKSFLEHIWVPSISTLSEKYMRAKDGFDMVRLSGKEHQVTFVRRFKYKITCFTSLNDFPFDEHECSFVVGSFQDKDERFITEGIFDNHPKAEVIINVRPLNERESVYVLMEGDYSVAGFVATFQRRLMKIIVFYYVPCVFLSLGIWLMILWGNTYEERFLFLVFASAILLYILSSASQILPCSASDFTLLEIWLMIHVAFVVASFLELKISHWWYLKSFAKRLLEYSTKKSKIDLVYFFLYLILYCTLVGGYIAFCLLV